MSTFNTGSGSSSVLGQATPSLAGVQVAAAGLMHVLATEVALEPLWVERRDQALKHSRQADM